MGLAAEPVGGATGESLMCAADEAMYLAKRRGRDRLEVAGC